ncbi:MAG TPA: hypothetical protein VN083_08910 [Vicinamibacteria bacterium]|jgi:hypothetical protein|nr:hypothetical protein [Vicinamibacteria bacterium]
MDMKSEGWALPPFPRAKKKAEEGVIAAARFRQTGSEPRCEMCGETVIATHCKRICLRCGFMTGCSEGL